MVSQTAACITLKTSNSWGNKKKASQCSENKEILVVIEVTRPMFICIKLFINRNLNIKKNLMWHLRNSTEDKQFSFMKDIFEAEFDWPKIKSYKTLK